MTLLVAALTVALLLELITEHFPAAWPNARVAIAIITGTAMCWGLGDSPLYGGAAAYLGFAATAGHEWLIYARDEKQFHLQKLTRVRRPLPSL